jgi:integrase
LASWRPTQLRRGAEMTHARSPGIFGSGGLRDTRPATAGACGTPKSHHRRSVPFPRSLVDPLTRQTAGRPGDALLFTAPEGGVLRVGNFRKRVFDRAAREAGLEGLTPHELRHTAASLAVSAGANVKAVQRLLGHASAAMTLDVYSGLFDDDLDAVADRLDEAAARARADSVRTDAAVVSITSRPVTA